MVNKIEEELKAAGANSKEISELSLLAKKLSDSGLSKIERNFSIKRRFLEGPPKAQKRMAPKWFFFPAITFCLALLFGATVAQAQSALPGQPLYTLKRASEDVITSVNPQFKNEVVFRRSQEVKKLTEQKKIKPLEKAIEDYKKERKEVRKRDAEKIERSRKNLEEAREIAPESVRKEIQKILDEKEEEQREVKGMQREKREEKKEKNKEQNEKED